MCALTPAALLATLFDVIQQPGESAMAKNGTYDAVVIGSGLGSLTAAAILSRAGKRVAVVERNRSLGGAASCYRTGKLTIEASLHETADPHDPRDLKHAVLSHLGLLDKIEWVPISNLHTVIGGPVGAPLQLGHGFETSGDDLSARFPERAAGIRRLLQRMDEIYTMVGSFNTAGETRSLSKLLFASKGSWPMVRDWRRSLDEALERDLGDCEGAKCALAANLAYYADDPRKTWWIFFAVAQGGYFGSGGVYIRGGSTRLSRALAKIVKLSGGDVFLGRKATDIDIDEAPRLALDAEGGLHCVWQSRNDAGGSGGDWDVFYRQYLAGTGWLSVEPVNGDAATDNGSLWNDDVRPNVAVLGDGTAVVLWVCLVRTGSLLRLER